MKNKIGVGARFEDVPVQDVLGLNTAFNRCDVRK